MKAIKNMGGYGMGGSFDQPGYSYDPVNDTFKDLETGKVFSKDYVAPGSSQGSTEPASVLEDNKATTIDVSQYTDPVEITPTSGNDGMKKVIVTLDNIPSGSGGNVPPFSLNFKGWKAARYSVGTDNYVYVGFLKDGDWITDKSIITSIASADEVDISGIDYVIVINSGASYGSVNHLWYNTNKYNAVDSTDYDYPYWFPNLGIENSSESFNPIELESLSIYDNELCINSSSSSQHTDHAYGWQTAEFVENVPFMVYNS